MYLFSPIAIAIQSDFSQTPSSSLRTMAEDTLEDQCRYGPYYLRDARNELNLRSLSILDANYWISAAAICDQSLELSNAQLQLANREEAKLQLSIARLEEGKAPWMEISFVEEDRRREDLDIRRLVERITATTY